MASPTSSSNQPSHFLFFIFPLYFSLSFVFWVPLYFGLGFGGFYGIFGVAALGLGV
jgi:hypothetical protein